MDIQHFNSTEDFIKSKEILLTENWKIKSDNKKTLVFAKNTSKIGLHVILFIIFGFWTFGAVNIGYYLFSNQRKTLVYPNKDIFSLGKSSQARL
jgi:hypothetical protein